MDGVKYAQVVVHVPLTPAPPGAIKSADEIPPPAYAWLERSFTYDIPIELQEAIRVGQLVWVPFGPRRLQGIVVGLTETTELDKTRSLEAIVYPEPFLTLQQLELAHWISRRYLAPLAESVWLFMPPGIEDKVETVLEASAEGDASGLTEKQRALVEKIRTVGAIKMTQLGAAERATANTLAARGMLIKRAAVRPGKARPRRIDTVQLTAALETARGMIAGLDRRTAVLRALAASDMPLTLEELATQTHASDATLKRLETEGLVERLPAVTWYQLSAAYLNEVPALPQAQGRICVYLREHGPRVRRQDLEEALELSTADLARLVSRGWVEKIQQADQFRRQSASAVPRLSAAHTRLVRAVEFLAQEAGPVWVSAFYAATDATRADVQKLEQLGLVTLASTELIRNPLAGRTFTPTAPPSLTSEQAAAWRELERALNPPHENGMTYAPRTFLLHGVTGSGKTELYLDAIDRVLAEGKQAIALVPEIALTPQTIRRFGARFGERIGVIHSHLKEGERYDTWRQIRDGKIDVVIGARSALFAPLPRLGLVVIDEEHDASYKNDLEFTNQPPYHAREIALEMARQLDLVVILGSATPDVETFFKSERGQIRRLELPQRVIAHEQVGTPVQYQELPPVEIVDLRAELISGNRSIFSRALQVALNETLARGEQAILFLNRRGTASALVCRDCGQAVKCSRCRNPFTLHKYKDAAVGELVCHHCGKRAKMPYRCPNCGSTRLRGLGLGTEKLEEQVRAEFPLARTLRWDFDVTQGKDAHELLLEAFLRGDANVLIGTQMIAKGLDLPRVTLVGAVNADTSLFLPDFRAGERTFQLLAQVAGRAGRSARGGKAILQTYNPENYAIQAAAHHAYREFYAREMEFRREAGYPPYRPLIRLLWSGDSAAQGRDASEQYGRMLHERVRREGQLDVEVVGPAPAFFARLRGKYRYHILVRGHGGRELLASYPPPPHWRIDVDPLDLL